MLNQLYSNYIEGPVDGKGSGTSKVVGKQKKAGPRARPIRSAMRNQPRAHHQTAGPNIFTN